MTADKVGVKTSPLFISIADRKTVDGILNKGTVEMKLMG